MRQRFTYQTEETCSESLSFELENGRLRAIKFEGGCDGNLQGISRLLEGMEATEVIRRLKGIPCGGKRTSCPDQLARALEKALASTRQEAVAR